MAQCEQETQVDLARRSGVKLSVINGFLKSRRNGVRMDAVDKLVATVGDRPPLLADILRDLACHAPVTLCPWRMPMPYPRLAYSRLSKPDRLLTASVPQSLPSPKWLNRLSRKLVRLAVQRPNAAVVVERLLDDLLAARERDQS